MDTELLHSDLGELTAACCCLVGGSWEGNQSSVNILDAITSCWTLPNTFMEALGKVFLYQPLKAIRTITCNFHMQELR